MKLTALRSLLKSLKSYMLASIIIEVACTVLIGISAKNIETALSPWMLLLVFCAILLIAILSFKYTYLKNFPVTLVDSIEQEFANQNLKQDFSRISLINDSVANALISLNSQTCQLTDQVYTHLEDNPVEDKLCSRGLEEGLIELLDSFLRNLHNISDSANSKFTVGIHLNGYMELPKDDSGNFIDAWKEGLFVLKDDLNLGVDLPVDILNKSDARGVELEIQGYVRACLNNCDSLFVKNLRENDNLSVYTNMIPVVCSEEDSSGVLLIIGDDMTSLPNDFDEVTRIHNRIVANWINKYNDCVTQKMENQNKNPNH